MREPYQRLQTARQRAGFENATDAARAFGWNENTYRSHENGERGLKKDIAEKYARAFGVSPAWLLTGEGVAQRKNIVMVAGSVITSADITSEGQFEVEVPFPIEETAIAFAVVGEGMWPRYESGDIVICERDGSTIDQVLGWEAAVQTVEQKRYLRRVLKGSRKGLYDLESSNAATIRDVKLEWVGAVLAVVRASHVQRVDPKGRQTPKKRQTSSK